MAAPVFVDVGDAVEGADLVCALEPHGFTARLAPAGDCWKVEVSSPCEDPRIFLADLGVALVRWSGRRIAAEGGDAAWPPEGDATAGVAALSGGDQAGTPLRLRLRALLLGSVWFELDRHRNQLGLDGASADAVGRQLADAAYTALLAKIGDFHGQSRFTTWAAKFGIHEAALAAREMGETSAARTGDLPAPHDASPIRPQLPDAHSRPSEGLAATEPVGCRARAPTGPLPE